jgi:hypothetical protein
MKNPNQKWFGFFVTLIKALWNFTFIIWNIAMTPDSIIKFNSALFSFSVFFIIGGIASFFSGPITMNTALAIAAMVGITAAILGYFFPKFMSTFICIISFGTIDID